MAAAIQASEPEAIPRTAFDISAIPGLAERLEPTRTTTEAIKANKRKDGRGLDAWRAAHVTTNGDAATATIKGSRATARARIAAPEKDEPRLGFEVRRGALAADDRWCRRVAQLLEDCWADGAALDRGVLDDGVARKVEVLVTCESDDGGVEDCALLAASAAIASLENTPLVLHAAPLTCAVTEDGAVLADPSIDEASGCARVTVVVGVDRVNGVASDAPLLKMSVNGAMPAAALEHCVALAAKRAATIRWPHAMAD